jgi:hypothetical protein
MSWDMQRVPRDKVSTEHLAHCPTVIFSASLGIRVTCGARTQVDLLGAKHRDHRGPKAGGEPAGRNMVLGQLPGRNGSGGKQEAAVVPAAPLAWVKPRMLLREVEEAAASLPLAVPG